MPLTNGTLSRMILNFFIQYPMFLLKNVILPLTPVIHFVIIDGFSHAYYFIGFGTDNYSLLKMCCTGVIEKDPIEVPHIGLDLKLPVT